MQRVSGLINLEYARSRGIMGRGVGVAVVDTGLSDHPDFFGDGESRIVGFADMIHKREALYDDNGHGTHIAGIIGGSGSESNGLYMGVAPQCHLVGVKVLNHKGDGDIENVLAGLEWVIQNHRQYNIRIVNISVGTPIHKEFAEDSELVMGVNRVWDAGLVVLVAAGNNGPGGRSIGAPGNSRKIITVGASDDSQRIEVRGRIMRDYSGRGPTKACIKKPDIVAPGSNVISCNATKNFRMPPGLGFMQRRSAYQHFNNRYTSKSGTSMSTPIVTGAIALLLSQYPYMTNLEVKIRLKNTAVDMGWAHAKQGWGMLDVERLLI